MNTKFIPTLLLGLATLLPSASNASSFANNKVIFSTAATATAASTTTLTKDSEQFQQFTGSTTQTVVLPNATTLKSGTLFVLSNDSSGAVTVNYNGGSGATSLATDEFAFVILKSNGSAAGTWDIEKVSPVGSSPITASRMVCTNASGGLTACTATDTQAGYLANATSNLCGITQSCTITSKTIAVGSNTISGTASRAAEFSAGGALQASTVTTTQLALLGTATNSNTASTLVLRDGSGNFSAGTVSAALSGNASTATALAANPSDCSAGQKATAIDASGNLTCSSVSLSTDVSGSLARSSVASGSANHVVINDGSGNLSSEAQLANSRGGTGQNTSASTGVPSISSGTWSVNTKLPETLGGTNQSSYATGDLLYASGSNTLSKLAVGSSGQALKVSGGVPAWGSVASQGVVNFISNGDFETDTTGWVTYADAAGNVPVDATGGTATNLTFSRSTSSPLVGGGMGSLVQANSTSLQGKGVSYDFTIDAAFKARMLAVNFEYNASSTFVASNGTTAPLNDGTTTTNAGNSDIETFVYDVTNSVLIPVSPQVITANGSNNFHFSGTFQTASNSTSYRLIFHVASTSANATGWTFKFDNVTVGPQVVQQGPPVTDWVAYTPTISAGFGTTTNVSFFYSRVGDRIWVRGTFTSGTSAASLGTISLPAGLSLDTGKTSIANTSSQSGPRVGDYRATAANNAGAIVTATGTSTTVVYYAINNDSVAGLTPSNINGFITGSTVQAVNFSVPVAGWSSTVQMSNDTDTRVVAARASGDAASATTGNIIIFPTADFDSHATYSTSTGRYSVPVAGFYDVSFFVNGNNSIIYDVYNNGSSVKSVASSTSANGRASGTVTVRANAGDLLDLRPTNGTSDVDSASWVSFRRLTGPSTIASSDSVNARYYASGTSISGSLATISWTTKDYDSHGAMSSGTYTVPIPGKYHVGFKVALSGTFILNNTTVGELQKNGTAICSTTKYIAAAITNDEIGFECEVNALAGDTLRAQVSNSGTTPAIVSSNTRNWVHIARVGN